MKKKTALVAGASGLVGSYCLEYLLADPATSRVIVLVRKPLELKHPKLAQLVVDFDHLEKFKARLKADEVYCCLGTTRKKTPDDETYRKIDFGYVFQLARLSSRNKSKQFLVVSSLGADPNSPFIYGRIKGEMEEAVSVLDFKAVHIFQPSFILGERARKESRPMERVLEIAMKPLAFFFLGFFGKYKPVEGRAIARAMIRTAGRDLQGVHVWESNRIAEVGQA